MSGGNRWDSRIASRIRHKLLAWFDRQKRDMPWRRTADPYAIWISETMLQQTQVATVIAYYEKFMARFPSVDALAAADLDDVLQCWAGLGYYARARNLHRAAQTIIDNFNGAVPSTVEELLTLSGVGPYTAGAVASIAFHKRAPVVDGNVARVLARLFEMNGDISDSAGRKLFWEWAGRLLPSQRCGDFNQAMMELGSTVCLPGSSAFCETCPLKNECRALALGTVAQLPIKQRKAKVRRETHLVAAIEHDGRWLAVRRPKQGLWGGLWELPTVVLNGDKKFTLLRNMARQWLDCRVIVEKRPFCKFTHPLTHRRITFVGYLCHPSHQNPAVHPGRQRRSLSSNNKKTANTTQWLTLKQLRARGISAAMRHVIDALC